ncbi:hypothetical protein BAZSYMB_GCONTIG00586_0 [Bathymodiolus azoricus thioautotrophic gill symbiont]|uniref:Uncharacterized protein n=1 Tax=Bathymodiolus azoricus thioautotrophic gill symbiont TaxID=235205 RepID=A0A1H6MAV2_9GAMM|nr:hypothetical protein BAZSYMB_GCONTIG00586_0 [Bathymodiolus azoricus thioautotrophic gill symbiont]
MKFWSNILYKSCSLLSHLNSHFFKMLFKYISIHSCKFHQPCFSITPKDSIPLI